MWLAGEVFPRAWKLLGYCRSWLGLLSQLSGSLACRVVIRHRLGEPVGLVVLCGCIMHGGWMHQPAAETHAFPSTRLKRT